MVEVSYVVTPGVFDPLDVVRRLYPHPRQPGPVDCTMQDIGDFLSLHYRGVIKITQAVDQAKA